MERIPKVVMRRANGCESGIWIKGTTALTHSDDLLVSNEVIFEKINRFYAICILTFSPHLKLRSVVSQVLTPR